MDACMKIRVPATSANIGSGFDSLGLALNMYNYVWMEEQDGVEIISLDETPIPTDKSNLIYQSAQYLYDLCGKKLPGLKIKQLNNIPMARGLGSSSACIVAGLLGANRLLNSPLSVDDLVNIAAVKEGHPDNSTPAILGGLVTAVLDGGKVYKVKQEIMQHMRFAAFIPDFELKTEVARHALPQEIAHRDGAYNLARAALMSVSLYSGHFENLRVAAGDKLHQPYRLQYITGASEVFGLSYDLGAYATYISGAGSTLMSIISDQNSGEFEEKARKALDDMGFDKWRIEVLDIDNSGTKVTAS